jgi:hypothetical protein
MPSGLPELNAGRYKEPETRLAGWLGPLDWLDDHGPYLEGDLICPCGAWWFKLLYPGQTHTPSGYQEPIPCVVKVSGKRNEFNYVFGVDAVCAVCRRQVSVFDSKHHGQCWLGADGHSTRPRSLDRSGSEPWACSACGGLPHRARLHFRLVDRADFLEEYAPVCGEERWGDAFHWFGFTAIQCRGCGHRVESWAGYECD